MVLSFMELYSTWLYVMLAATWLYDSMRHCCPLLVVVNEDRPLPPAAERGACRSEQREGALSPLGLSLSVFYPCLCWAPEDYWCFCIWLQTGPWCTVLGAGQRGTASGGGGGGGGEGGSALRMRERPGRGVTWLALQPGRRGGERWRERPSVGEGQGGREG